MQNSGKTGWLYRVIAGGQVSSDAPARAGFRLSDVSVHEAGAIAWQMPFVDDQYRLLSAARPVCCWRRTMQKRRLSGKIEDSLTDYGNNPHIKYSRGCCPARRRLAQAGSASGSFAYSGSQVYLNADHPSECRRLHPAVLLNSGFDIASPRPVRRTRGRASRQSGRMASGKSVHDPPGPRPGRRHRR